MVGRLAIRHGQLDHQLKMVIKTLKNIDPETAVDEHDFKTTNLRDEIKLLTKNKFGVDSGVYRELGKILTRCKELSEGRNRIIHAGWARTHPEGVYVLRTRDGWGPIPKAGEVQGLSRGILDVTKALSDARLTGFLRQALDVVGDSLSVRDELQSKR